ncbi:MAG: YtxH domain-containing protein [Owenweeksia sp.]|nr:YtxH domain-containing protein [Owenweeksia sp.]
MSSQSGNVILGTLVGAAAGFAAGILLAPAKGSETREKLSEQSNDLKSTINDAADRAVASLKDLRESAENSFRHQKNEVKTKANEAAASLKNSK